MTRLLPLVTFLLGLGPPGAPAPALIAQAPRQGPEPQSAQPLRFELANGLRVWIQEDHRRPVVLVRTSYRVGSLAESPGTTGTAH